MIHCALGTFFKYAHRQPFWPSDRDNFPNASSSEELILVILSIAAQRPPEGSSNEILLSPESYSDAARSMMMLEIVSASVDLSVLQALCLLVYSNHLCKAYHYKT